MAAVIFALTVLMIFAGFTVLNLINANETLRAVFRELRCISEAIEPFGWDGSFDDIAPDMIALLGDAYASKPFTGARDMTGDELAELIESKGAYDPYAQQAARDPLGR